MRVRKHNLRAWERCKGVRSEYVNRDREEMKLNTKGILVQVCANMNLNCSMNLYTKI